MTSPAGPTPYPDVNAVLGMMLMRLRPTLGDQFAGLYLTGSLAGGDFDPDSSDIDFVVVTSQGLDEKTCRRLQAMHSELRASGLTWATKLEGDYIPRDTLRRFDPVTARYPRLSVDGRLAVEQHFSDEVIQRQIMREHGVVLSGPAPRSLIAPVQPDELRAAVRGILRDWWVQQVDNPVLLQTREYQAYAVLTMCRSLYTIQHGAVISKPAAAQWALEALDARWAALIRRGLRWRGDTQPDATRLREVLAFVRFTLKRAG